MDGDLRRGPPDPERRAEIDPELDRRLARLGEGLGIDDGADPDIDLFEVAVADHVHHAPRIDLRDPLREGAGCRRAEAMRDATSRGRPPASPDTAISKTRSKNGRSAEA